ncbi:beta strand repeat-containing protein [Flavobacterium panici]|uniref:Tail fiber protein n=1 Tax=Flavobacterium panici TaxID=2654843 RepID=A0A9N8IYK0_9FLAO|nr:hypothetical protein [Flavobacterium panici]CAC9972906.1 hypothetical protein FLAPXU55_00585 [Flavobacterium panici]
MAQKHINTSTPNDNLGDTLRDANIKCEDNFTELYATKVDKISGKGLSTNDYTTAEKNKLAGIPADAEKNVQSDWLDNDTASDAYIKNKPDILTSVEWGDITGDITDQADLQLALDYKPSFEYVDTKVTQTINEGTTGYAPSEDAVYNALLLKQDISEKDQANGYAGLDSAGKILTSQLPNSVMEYKGVYNASTNTPTLVNGTGNTGDVYRVTVSGSGVNNLNFVVGDYVVYNGTTWEKQHSGADNVVSVFGRAGVVTAMSGDYTTAQVNETTNKNYQTDNQKLYNDATSSIQTQLNGKQATITGTTNVIPKFTGLSTFGNSAISDDGTNILITQNTRITASIPTLSLVNSASSPINKRWDVRVSGSDLFFTEAGVSNPMSIQAGGNVGIGTITPVGKLNVNTGLSGITVDVSGQTEGTISFANGGGSSAVPTLVGKSSNNAGLQIMAGVNESNPSPDMILNTRSTTGLDFTGTTGTAFRFTRYATSLVDIMRNGNVGIGTSSPSAKLHIVDVSGGTFFDGSNATYNRFKSTGVASTTGKDLLITAQSGGTNPDLYLTTNGRVGIGVTSPVGRLDINTGAIGLFDVSGQTNGSVSIGNASSISSVPVIVGKSTDSVGLYLMGSASNGNSNADMQFDIRTNAGVDFSATTSAGFRFSRMGTTLVEILRNGQTTFNSTVFAPTASAGTSNTQVATTAFVNNAISGLTNAVLTTGNQTKTGRLTMANSTSATTQLLLTDTSTVSGTNNSVLRIVNSNVNNCALSISDTGAGGISVVSSTSNNPALGLSNTSTASTASAINMVGAGAATMLICQNPSTYTGKFAFYSVNNVSKFEVQNDGTVQAGGFVRNGSSSNDFLMGDGSVRTYKTYVGLITQTGTSAPTVTVLENTLGATLTFAYSSTGTFTATAGSTVFTTDKTLVNLGIGNSTAAVMVLKAVPTSTSVVTINTYNSSATLTNGLINRATFEIKVFS